MSTLDIILITGLSGSGKSSALHALEDLGYFCIDNLPVQLTNQITSLSRDSNIEKLGLVMDIRNEEFVDHFPKVLSSLRKASAQLRIIFLESDIKNHSAPIQHYPKAPPLK